MTVDLVNRNFLNPTQFSFKIEKLADVNFYIQKVNLPGLSMGVAPEGSPFQKLSWPGDHIDWQDFTITFKVDEGLRDWFEIFNWLQGQGFPENFRQYRDLKNGVVRDIEGNARIPAPNPPKQGHIWSPSQLIIHTSHNNPNIQIDFASSYPISLSELKFDSTVDDIKYLTASATFRYDYYTVSQV